MLKLCRWLQLLVICSYLHYSYATDTYEFEINGFGKFYFNPALKKSADSANKFCTELWNGTGRLATFKTDDKQKMLRRKITSQPLKLWISAMSTHAKSYRSFRDFNGCFLTPNELKSKQVETQLRELAATETMEMCIYSDAKLDFFVEHCQEHHYFVCEKINSNDICETTWNVSITVKSTKGNPIAPHLMVMIEPKNELCIDKSIDAMEHIHIYPNSENEVSWKEKGTMSTLHAMELGPDISSEITILSMKIFIDEYKNRTKDNKATDIVFTVYSVKISNTLDKTSYTFTCSTGANACEYGYRKRSAHVIRHQKNSFSRQPNKEKVEFCMMTKKGKHVASPRIFNRCLLVINNTEFRCQNGYYTTAKNLKITCKKSYDSVEKAEKFVCKPVTCKLKQLDGVIPKKPTLLYHQVASCDKGYKYIGISSKGSESVCQDNGVLADFTCEKISCRGDYVNYENVRLPRKGELVKYGEKVYCEKGNILTANPRDGEFHEFAECQKNGKMTPEHFSCNPVFCYVRTKNLQSRKDIKNGRIPYGTYVNCAKGYGHKGSANMAKAICTENGGLSIHRFNCEKVICLMGKFKAVYNEKISCRKGYGHRGDARITSTTCMANGHFHLPSMRCERVKCTGPFLYKVGIKLPKMGFVPRFREYVSCRDGYNFETRFSEAKFATCMYNGRLDLNNFICRRESCNIGFIKHRHPSRRHRIYFGEKVICREGFGFGQFPDLKQSVTCEHREKLSIAGFQCQPIKCKISNTTNLSSKSLLKIGPDAILSYGERVECMKGYSHKGDNLRRSAKCFSDGKMSIDPLYCEKSVRNLSALSRELLIFLSVGTALLLIAAAIVGIIIKRRRTSQESIRIMENSSLTADTTATEKNVKKKLKKLLKKQRPIGRDIDFEQSIDAALPTSTSSTHFSSLSSFK